MSLQKNHFWSGEEIYKEKERKGGRFMGDLKGWKKCQRSMCIFIYVHMYMYIYIYIKQIVNMACCLCLYKKHVFCIEKSLLQVWTQLECPHDSCFLV